MTTFGPVSRACGFSPFSPILAGICNAHIHSRMRKVSVLFVDDDRDARTMYRMFLKHVGCRVRTARDGQIAIDTANDWTPDVIVMDLSMPRLDGWTASRWLKA